jgi:hypothetical protein
MACGTEIVPGYKAFDQVISKNVTNPGLEAKMNQLLAQAEKKTKKKQK